MPYANNEGVLIHYKIEGEGPPLVLHHWSFGTLEDWYDYGYVSALRNDYQLILLNARGHGASDKLYDPAAYRLEQRVYDIVTILDDLGIANAHFYGYSMGGWIGFGIAHYASERLRSLIIGGQHPYAQNLHELREIARYGIKNGHEAFIDMWKRDIGPVSSEQKERMLTYDFDALLAVAQDRESLEAGLPTMTMPCMLIVGEKDNAYQAAQKCFPRIPTAKFVTVPGADHFGGFRDSELVIPHIKKFLSDLNQ